MVSKKHIQPIQSAQSDVPPAASFPIVGIGASAGGLAAFEAFFSGMPADAEPGMAFVLVQHLAPDHKSILSDLLKRYTRMQVFEVDDGMEVKPNCAYIIPPNRDMALLNGSLQLLEPSAPRGQRLPIDFFFRSMAQDQHERAICIVLSGTGSDGALGVRSVKGEGGMVMAQTPETTEYDGMPRSAIATGMVDFVLPPDEMMPQLMSFVGHAFGKAAPQLTLAGHQTEDWLKKIFVLLRTQTDHDFSHYKRNTIIRRIERRMAVHQIKRLQEYVRYCQQNLAEVNALFGDLLIGVTQFFRDPEAFHALIEQAVPRLLAEKPDESMIRVWVPGCSTGEEAYSIAMVLLEQMDGLQKQYKMQVFATDLDSKAIDMARRGIYPASIAADVSPERLTRFFQREVDGSTYRVHKQLRDLLIFSEQNLIKDPPFSKLDLISCRNLLIYFDGELQKKVIPLFCYALNQGGLLFLGTSESVGEFGNLFVTLDRKARLYQRKMDNNGAVLTLETLPPKPATAEDVPQSMINAPGETRKPLLEMVEQALLQHYAAVGVLVGERGDIHYLYGRTGRYLEPAPGEASLNVLKMARDGLRPALTAALHKAAKYHEPVFKPGLRVKTNGGFSPTNLTVRPVPSNRQADDKPPLFLVVLEESSPPHKDQEDFNRVDDMAVDARILALQQELRAADEYLRSNTEELETANEELKSANEELQSVNEELQSTNEELETSKEELQSVNEELATVNNEMQIKLADLARANNDMSNLLASTDIGTVFVDLQLRIQRFTPAVTQVINLIPGDVGRPVVHIVSNLVNYGSFEDDVKAVLDCLIPREREVQTQTGAWFLLRIRPYRTVDNMIEGAVITFVDITELKQAQAMAQENQSMRHLAAVVLNSHDAILSIGLDGCILTWNPAASRMYGWSEAEAVGKNHIELITAESREDARRVMHPLDMAKTLAPCPLQRIAKEGRSVPIWLIATALLDENGKVYAISTTERERNVDNLPEPDADDSSR